MSTRVPKEFEDLFRKKAFGHLATLMPDGQPQTTPVWVDYDGQDLLVNTVGNRQKFRNLERDPRVSISIQDPDDPYRYLEVRGRVTKTTEVGADRHIDELAKRYLGQDRYPWRAEGERRVLVRIAPEHTNSLGSRS